jgi:hypothetical protein
MSAQFFLMDRLRQEVSMRLPSLTSNPVAPVLVHTFDYRVRALNGSCLLGSGVLAVADCFAGLIWRVDLGPGAHSATARVWAAHDTMGDDPDGEIPWPPQPGVNGVRYAEKTGYLYYTSTAQKVFMRVPVDPATLDAAGTPEFVAAITDGDDFCLDEVSGHAYVARHPSPLGTAARCATSRATRSLVHDAGHALFPEQPAAVAAIVVEYLRDHPSTVQSGYR